MSDPATTPAGPQHPGRHDLAVHEAAAAICPAEHRHRGSSCEPPCGDCWKTADAAVNAYLDTIQTGQGTKPGEPR